MKSLELKKDIYWIGTLDPNLRIFDIIMETKYGTTYNSYLVKGKEKIAIFETTKEKYFDDYLKELEERLPNPEKIDYIIVDHTEPDHSGAIVKLLDYAKNATVVGSHTAIEFLKNIINKDFRHIAVKDGDIIDLGGKTLKFISAPFLHWPDSMYTYIPEDKVLITCDSFGSHYSSDKILYSKLTQEELKDYRIALRYYFMCIFGPFKKYVLQGINKIKDLPIDIICTGHGPVLDRNPFDIVNTYEKWSIEENPNKRKTVIIPYVSAYGYTGKIAEEIKRGIEDYDSSIEVKLYNLDVDNFKTLEGEILREFQWADGILLGSCTINGDALPPIWSLATSLNPIIHGGKYASAFGSYGWSGEAVPNMIKRLEELRMHVLDGYMIKFKPSETDMQGAFKFGRDFGKAVAEHILPEKKDKYPVTEEKNPDKKIIKWKCTVCGEIYEGIEPPEICPACGVGREYFIPVEDEKQEPIKEQHMKLVIVGTGIAGVTAAETARKINPAAEIYLIGREKELPYYRTLLSEVIYDNKIENKLTLKPKEWYEENRIELKLGLAINNINIKEKYVEALDGEKFYYDKLILANGSRSMVPDIGNNNLAGVFTLREKIDVDLMKKYAIGKKKAIVVGGGVLGLETAWGLKQLGMNVEIIEMMQRILPRQLDETGSEFLEKNIEVSGITVHKNSRVSSFTGENYVDGLVLDNGSRLDCDMVVISSGIVPNVELIANKGLKTNRGIIVNNEMETSMEDIYACGDVAEYNGRVIGLWQISLSQGKVAGSNAMGVQMKYTEELQPVTYEGMGTHIISVGTIVDTKDSLAEVDSEMMNYKKLYFKDEKLTGGILIGDISKGVTIITGIKNSINKSNLLKKLYN